MRMLTPFIVLILALALLSSGCTSQNPAPAVTPAPTPVPQTPSPAATPSVPVDLLGNWQLTAMGIQNGNAVAYPTTAINLIFNADNTFTGYDGCNNYFGSFALNGVQTPKGQEIVLSNIGATKKYCQELAEQEQQYLNILGKTRAWVGDGTQLTLTASTGDALIYKRPSAIATPAQPGP